MDYCQSLLSFTLRRWVQTWLNYQIIYISKYHLTKFVDRNGATFGRKWMRWSCGATATPKKVEAGNIPRKLWCQKPFYILVNFYTCWKQWITLLSDWQIFSGSFPDINFDVHLDMNSDILSNIQSHMIISRWSISGPGRDTGVWVETPTTTNHH
jgi:hypothetical protein